MKKKVSILFLFGFLFLAIPAMNAAADPVDVSYTVSGSSGAYTLDFSVTNNLSAPFNIYQFAVDLPAGITGIPTGFQQGIPQTYSGYPGGSSIFYYNVWGNNTAMIVPGETLSGFDVLDTASSAPTSVNWAVFAFGNGAIYTGGGNFNNDTTPGFQSVAFPSSPSATPIPGTAWLLGSGLVGLIGLKRKYLG